MSNSWHPDEEQLLAFADGELDPKQSAVVDEHARSCAACEDQIADFRSVYGAVRSSVRSQHPPPPKPWADLRPRLIDLDVGRVRTRRLSFPRVSFRWAAAAAAVIAGLLVVRLTTEQTVSAAELLEKSSVQEAKTGSPKRIRVKTRKASWVRSARTPTRAEDVQVASLFQQANYNWEEPLSSRSFADWRSSLPEKDDRIRILKETEYGSGRFYLITTSTPTGLLAEATITIRGEDLRAVRETFHFRNNEYVELAEVTEPEPSIPELQLAQPSPVIPHQPRAIGASEELKVMAALHSIGADLGEPVDLDVDSANGRIVVTALATRADRQQQLRAVLSGISFVQLRFEQPDVVRAQAQEMGDTAAAETRRSNPLQDELAGRLGSHVALENFTNHIMDFSEAVLTRAHALRSLAQRFSLDIEKQLGSEDRNTLDAIKTDHILKLQTTIRGISDAMQTLSVGGGGTPSVTTGTWQTATQHLLESAQSFDRVATEILAGSGTNHRISDLTRAAVELQSQADVLGSTIAESRRR
jgi:hypothetical protein